MESQNSNKKNIDPALLATIAKGHLAKNLRLHGARKRNSSLETPLNGDVLSDCPEPEEELIVREIGNRLLAAINKLDEIERTIIFARFFQGASLSKLEEQLELTRQQIKTRYNRGIILLRKTLIMDGLI